MNNGKSKNIMDNSIFQDLILFIQDVRWEYQLELHPNISLERDLKITGDDAVEFIIAFGRRFNVDVSNFKADDYFESEGISLSSIVDVFRKSKKEIKKELSLGDLEKAIENKVLI